MNFEQRIKDLNQGDPLHPFDWMNNGWAYDPKPSLDSASHAQRVAQSRIAYVSVKEQTKGAGDIFFWPGPMSTDLESYKLVLDNADKVKQATRSRFGQEFLTVVNVGQYIAPKLVKQYVTLANQATNRQLGARGRLLRPDLASMVPADFEASLHSMMSQRALSGGVTWQSYIFEQWWVPHVYDAVRFGLGGKHIWSYCGNIEELAAIVRQYGLAHDASHNRHIDIVDEYNQPVPHCDQAWERARHVWWLVEKGFRNDLAVATLLAQFQLHDWHIGRDPILNPKHMHEQVLHAKSDDIYRMEHLKEIMMPFLYEYMQKWAFDHNDLHLAHYSDAVLPHYSDQWILGSKNAHASALYAYAPKGGFDDPIYEDMARVAYREREREPIKIAFSTKQNLAATARPRTHADGHYFNAPSLIFDDGIVKDLSEREHAAAHFIVATGEAIVPSENKSFSLFVSADAKGGARSKTFGDKHGYTWSKDMQGHGAFYDAVISPNLIERDRLITWLEARKTLTITRQANHERYTINTKGIINSDKNIDRIAQSMAQNHAFSPAEGATRPSSAFRLAVGMEWLDRSAYGLIVREGWEHSNDDCAFVLRACLNALGTVDSATESKNRQMRVIVAKPRGQGFTLNEQTLSDIVETVIQKVLDITDERVNTPAARDIFVTAARLIHLSDMVVDQMTANTTRYNNNITGKISAQPILDIQRLASENSYFLYDYLHRLDNVRALRPASQYDDHIPTLYDRAKTALLNKAILHFTEDDCADLPPDYLAAWRKAHVQTGFEGQARHYGDAALKPRGLAPGGRG